MKKLSLVAMMLSLGLFAVGCETTTEDAVEEQVDAAGERAEADTAAKLGSDDTADQMDEAADATQEAAETSADAIDDGNPAPVVSE